VPVTAVSNASAVAVHAFEEEDPLLDGADAKVTGVKVTSFSHSGFDGRLTALLRRARRLPLGFFFSVE
tara:strand:- start:191 stop:394 length:204 start_codon:yes stop_codon:yes gene_type:complete